MRITQWWSVIGGGISFVVRPITEFEGSVVRNVVFRKPIVI